MINCNDNYDNGDDNGIGDDQSDNGEDNDDVTAFLSPPNTPFCPRLVLDVF